MDNAMKQDLKYIGILTIVGLVIIFILALVLPVRPNTYMQDINKSPETLAKDTCVSLCKANGKTLKNLDSGPCLSDLFNFDSNEYVCDIVNNPKIDVDNLPENQCKELIDGDKNKLIEVNTKCEFVTVN